jgi:hypothetical protein
MFFEPSSELKGPEVNVPDPISDFFESDLFAGADDRDVDPSAIPAAPRKVKELVPFPAWEFYLCHRAAKKRHQADARHTGACVLPL